MKNVLILLLASVSLFACKNYGKKVSKDNVEVYYKEGMTKEDAQRTLDFLVSMLGETEKKSFQLSKGNGDTIHFRMVADMEKVKATGDESFYKLASILSDSIFKGAPVNVLLANDQFETQRTMLYRKTELPKDKIITDGNIEVYVQDGINSEMATNLAAYLGKNINPQQMISFRIGRNEEGVYVLNMVTKKEKVNDIEDADMTDIASSVSKDILSGEGLIFQLTDSEFKPYRKVDYNISR
jgi:hypothetical protein